LDYTDRSDDSGATLVAKDIRKELASNMKALRGQRK
jgi:hypothetical protein